MADLAALENLLQFLTPAEKAELDALLAQGPVWDPLPGPQTEAYNSQADIIGYGGAAGGGKTDLLAGLCLTKHKRALVIRREKAQTDGIVQRLTEILGSTDGYNSQKSTWKAGETLIEFGGLDNPGDERRWQGRAHDLKAYDEVTEMREAQVRFTMGWLRSSDATVRSRILMTFNPPTTAEGSDVILCATGGEALYADMGHLGGNSIKVAWIFVLVALFVNYFGQGAYLLNAESVFQILFSSIRNISPVLYVQFLILALLATIIASQAMIRAVMSLVFQGINLRIFPMRKIKYTSSKLRTQIYIGSVNWILLVAVLLMILIFESSENLSAAYGLAVTATMTISAIFMVWFTKAGIEHWHGASPTEDMLQLAIYEGEVKWLEPVTDEVYRATPRK